MEYLQYAIRDLGYFVPRIVLNLIINGIPSIPPEVIAHSDKLVCFKPYYKWNTFNTEN